MPLETVRVSEWANTLRNIRRLASFALAGVLALSASPGFATPFAGAASIAIETQMRPSNAYRIATPIVLAADQSKDRIHGAVCRTSTIAARGPGGVRIERLDATGAIIAVARARLSRGLTGRDGGCAFYDQQTDWRLSSRDRLRLCIDGSGACRP